MANKEVIKVNDKELIVEVVTYPSKKKEMDNFFWKDIVSIRVEKGVEKKLVFFKKPYERLLIQPRNPETPKWIMPIKIDKSQLDDGEFEKVVEELKEYSKKKPFDFEDAR